MPGEPAGTRQTLVCDCCQGVGKCVAVCRCRVCTSVRIPFADRNETNRG